MADVDYLYEDPSTGELRISPEGKAMRVNDKGGKSGATLGPLGTKPVTAQPKGLGGSVPKRERKLTNEELLAWAKRMQAQNNEYYASQMAAGPAVGPGVPRKMPAPTRPGSSSSDGFKRVVGGTIGAGEFEDDINKKWWARQQSKSRGRYSDVSGPGAMPIAAPPEVAANKNYHYGKEAQMSPEEMAYARRMSMYEHFMAPESIPQQDERGPYPIRKPDRSTPVLQKGMPELPLWDPRQETKEDIKKRGSYDI